MRAADAGARAARSIRPRIMASVGEVPYEWSIASDALPWGANAADVLMVGDPAAIASGRSYAKLLGAGLRRSAASTR